jgi:hypothetical protein
VHACNVNHPSYYYVLARIIRTGAAVSNFCIKKQHGYASMYLCRWMRNHVRPCLDVVGFTSIHMCWVNWGEI